MKICACIAEYNPFHLGHLRHLNYIKEELKADNIIVVMSGNFTQRGEMAVMNKYKRAKHAILSGADIVIELPTVFATANAEIFAKGGINLINSLGIVDSVCFGVESGDKQSYLSLAKEMNNESKEFKTALKTALDNGISLAKAKFMAVKSIGGCFDEKLISSPNNILGLEYTKALLKLKSDIQIEPMIREGNHNDTTFKKGLTSATSIRSVIKSGKISKLKSSLPSYVYKDITDYPFASDKMFITKLITSSADDLAKITDCTEGLENRIKALLKDNKNIDTLVEKISTKRYTSTRIRRIITANLLGITDSFVKECLNEDLYCKVLAVKNDSKDIISTLNLTSKIPLIMRKSDTLRLKKTAQKSFEKDVLANELYNLAMGEKSNENQTIFV